MIMNRRIQLLVFACLISTSACAQSAADQHAINQAVSAAPDEMKEGAAVYGYNDDGTFKLIREGSNELSCTADDPKREGFEAACFHNEVFPYISRGRELRAGGMNGQESVVARGEEIEAGTLPWVEKQASQYIRYGEEATYDEATGEVLNSSIRFVIYIPGETSATTGLPTSPMGPGAPWLMSEGTFRAHIMVVPEG
jgi:hypothetical protein